MDSNLHYLEFMVKDRHRAFEEEARRIRLVKQARSGRSNESVFILEKFADLLIKTGVAIKLKYCGVQLPLMRETQGCLPKDKCRC